MRARSFFSLKTGIYFFIKAFTFDTYSFWCGLSVTYERERGGLKKRLDEVMTFAREILFSKITEEDIIAGELVSEGSKTKVVISKLGEYKGEDPYK